MSHDNINLVRRFFEEIWNQRRPETIDELLTADSICYTDDEPMRGPQEFKDRQYTPFTAAFPDLRLEIEGAIAQGDQVVVRWVATGRHDGGGLGFEATHETASFRGMSWIRVSGGKLIEGWQCSNIPEVVRGLRAKLPA